MKDWIIISYDCEYGWFSISIDGKVMNKDEINDIEDRDNSYQDIMNTYIWYRESTIKKIQTKYHKNILVCENGDIEFYEITRRD